MVVIGLTGSIGTGKSTAADYLAQKGVPVWSADAAVHDLYRGKAAQLVEAEFPGVLVNGEVSRERLMDYLMSNAQAIETLEGIIHPLVEQDRAQFIERHRQKGSRAVLLDIPLLFEKRLEKRVDLSLLITAAPAVQRERVLARPRMSERKFNIIRKRQMSQSDKEKKADYIIDNSGTLDEFYGKLDRFLESLHDGAEG